MNIPLAFPWWLASLVVLLGTAVVDQVSGQPTPLPPVEARAPRVDAFGDPLPDGAFARLGTVRFRQGEQILAVAISPDGKTIASGRLRTIHLWDAATGKRLHRLEGSDSWINSLAFLPDGKTLVSSSDREAIFIWDVVTGKQVRRLANPCSYLALAPDGKTLACADDFSVIRILDVASGEQLHQLEGFKEKIHALAFSPNGAILAWGGNDAGKDIHLRLADVKTGKELRRCQAEGQHIQSVAFSPDGKTLAASVNGQPIRFWEVANLNEVRQFAKAEDYRGTVLFAPGGKTLISGYHNGVIVVWETTSGKELRRWRAGPGGVNRLALAADGTVVAAGHGGLVSLWDVNAGKELGPAAGKQVKIERWAFSDDGKRVVSLCQDGTLRHWDAVTGRALRCLPGSHDWWRAALAPGGRELATLEEDRVVRLRRTDTGKEVWRFPVEGKDTYPGLGFSPDGKILVIGHSGPKLRLLDAATGKEQRRLEDGDNCFQTATFSPEAKFLITDHYSRDVGLSDRIPFPRVDRVDFWNASTGKKTHSIAGRWATESNDPYGLPMSVSRDGRMLALPNPDGSISLWEMATKRERLRSPPPEAVSKGIYSRDFLTFSPDGKLLFVEFVGQESNRLLVHETATGKALAPVVVHDEPLYDVRFSPDGKTLAALGKDGTILLCDSTRVCRHRAEAGRKLSVKELDSLWVDLAAEDASRAWTAIGALSSAPEHAVAYLNGRLTPAAPPPDAKRVARMILDLGSSNFQQRAKAARELEDLGDVAEPALQKALQRNPSVETRRRIETMLATLGAQILMGDMLREVRALEALEIIATPEARQVLTRLAKGAPGVLLTREAQGAIERLAKRTIAAP
jgi:WD40 repeat protein